MTITTVKQLNQFANGCLNVDELLKKLIEEKQIISEEIAKLVKPKH